MHRPKDSSMYIITAGSTYLDIDAYACMVAMAELLQRKGENAIAYSQAPCNYSICKSLIGEGQIEKSLPLAFQEENVAYIIVDVSDPDFLKDSVPLDQVTAVYDHHVGFEAYWTSRIGTGAHIAFIGAAATLIYREWKQAGLQDQMSRGTALLLIAAILDNTLNLTASNTTEEDVAVFNALCEKENVDAVWCAEYFSEVQANVEADLKNALFGDMKTMGNNPVLPAKIAQLCIWDADSVFARLPEIRRWFADVSDSWMLNIIDIQNNCSYFVCDDCYRQEKIEGIFGVRFDKGVARTGQPYLRKQIIKNVLSQS